MLTHVDLFSGIGGFTLAAQWAGFRTVVFCEIDEFCQEVLKAKFGAVADTKGMGRRNGIAENPRKATRKINPSRNTTPLLIPDIRDFDGTRWWGATLLTGGVPCQPASVAGKRKGTEDDRWLWPEVIRVLAEVKPTWAIFENPPGILSLKQGMVFEDLLSQMESAGYEVWPIIIPACAVNAPHRRDRVWIVAHSISATEGCSYGENIGKCERRRQNKNSNGWDKMGGDTPDHHSHAPDQEGICSTKSSVSSRDTNGGNHSSVLIRIAKSSTKIVNDVANTALISVNRGRRTWRGSNESTDGSWDIPWPEVATRLCRVDARVPNRVDRLKALGNAVVPQIPYEIIKAIAEIENEKTRT